MRELIYSKFSNERSRAYAVRTDIFEEDGKRSVRKTPLFPEGKNLISKTVSGMSSPGKVLRVSSN